MNIYGLAGSDAIRASLEVVYEEIEAKLKSDLLQMPEGYDNLISDIPYNSFIGQTAGQDVFISSSVLQDEYTPSSGSSTIVSGNDGTGGAPGFDETLGAN